MREGRERIARAATLAACVALAGGCVPAIPAGKYHAMRDSSVTVFATADRAYAKLGALQAQRIAYRAATGDRPLTVAAFQPDTSEKKTDIAGRMRARRAALEAVVRYLTALDAFATRDFEGEVDRAAQEFAGSVRTLASHAADDGEASEVSSALGTVVDVIGREVVRRKRHAGLRRVMTAAQDPLQKTCAYVDSGSRLAALAAGLLVQNIIAHANQLRPGTRIGRLPVDESVGRAVHDADTVRAGLAAVSQAMQRLPEAHAEVRRNLDEEVAPVEALRQLTAEAKRAKEFYEELE